MERSLFLFFSMAWGGVWGLIIITPSKIFSDVVLRQRVDWYFDSHNFYSLQLRLLLQRLWLTSLLGVIQRGTYKSAVQMGQWEDPSDNGLQWALVTIGPSDNGP